MGIYKSLYYENLLSIIINFLLFSCSGTSNLAKLLQDWQLFLVVYYENLLSIIINFLLFSCSGTSKLAKLLQDWQLFLVVYCLTGCHKIKVFSHLYMSKSLETLQVFIRVSFMGIYKSLYYENLLSIIINFLLFSQSCSGTSNLAKLLQDWQLFPVVYYENLLSIL